jgi:hypothetical protein
VLFSCNNPATSSSVNPSACALLIKRIRGAWLIQLPGQVLTGIGNTTLRAATSAAGIKGAFLPNSIRGLEPDSPLLLSMNKVPIEVPFHSIIGNRGRWNIPLKESSDGVVPYWARNYSTRRTSTTLRGPLTKGKKSYA